MTDLHPAVAHLRAVSRDYPGCWKAYDQFRQDRRELGDWPEWCYCPMAAAYAIVSGGGSNRLGLDRIGEVARLSALAASATDSGHLSVRPRSLRGPHRLAAQGRTAVRAALPASGLVHLPRTPRHARPRRRVRPSRMGHEPPAPRVAPAVRHQDAGRTAAVAVASRPLGSRCGP
ncbi:MAG: hypothetical protein MZV65_28555 [Chromatiales bacterium]|nr:hypothetical protein [Chromatiales bacterium]